MRLTNAIRFPNGGTRPTYPHFWMAWAAVGVLWSEFVAALALVLHGISGKRVRTSKRVHLGCDCLKMMRVSTGAVEASVVDLVSRRYRAMREFIGDAVSVDRLASFDSERGISVRCDIARPLPARLDAVSGIDECPKSSTERLSSIGCAGPIEAEIVLPAKSSCETFCRTFWHRTLHASSSLTVRRVAIHGVSIPW